MRKPWSPGLFSKRLATRLAILYNTHMDPFYQSQLSFLLALQNIGGLTGLMEFFTFLGREQFFLLLLPFIYLCLDPAAGARLVLILVCGDSINGFLKLAFHLPRPYWIDSRVQALSTETSYGLPSGHAQTAASVWFFIAGALRRPWGWAAAAVIVGLISLSRLYLGVHFPSDIVGGWFAGGAFLFAYLKIEPGAKVWLSQLDLGRQIAVAFIASLALALAGVGIRAALNGISDPEPWAALAADARSLAGTFAGAGSVCGIGIGLALANRWARFSAGGPLVKRVARFVIGLFCVGLVFFGLRAFFPGEPEVVALPLRYLRYALVTFTAIFIVPWSLLKLRLAEPK